MCLSPGRKWMMRCSADSLHKSGCAYIAPGDNGQWLDDMVPVNDAQVLDEMVPSDFRCSSPGCVGKPQATKVLDVW